MPTWLMVTLSIGAVAGMAWGCAPSEKTAPTPAPSVAIASYSRAQVDECHLKSNIVVTTKLDPSTKTWSEATTTAQHLGEPRATMHSDTPAVQLKVTNGRIKWSASPKAIVCWLVIDHRKSAKGDKPKTRVVNQPTGDFPTTATMEGVTLWAYLPEAAGPGVNRVYTNDELNACRGRGNIDASIQRDVSRPDLPWEPADVGLSPKSSNSHTPTDAVRLVLVGDYLYWSVKSGVITCGIKLTVGTNPAQAATEYRATSSSTDRIKVQNILFFNLVAYDNEQPDGVGSYNFGR